MKTAVTLVAAYTAWLLASVPAFGQSPQDALKLVPEKASGFVIVRDIGELNNKIETLAKRVAAPLPMSPLEWLKSELGSGAGQLNTKGSLLFTMILGEGEKFRLIPLLYVPVTDYTAFLRELKAEKDGDVATVQVGNAARQMLIGRQGNFAVITEPDCKDALQEVLRAKPRAGDALKSVEAHLVQNDVTGVLTSRGAKSAVRGARAALALSLRPAEAAPGGEFIKGWFDGIDRFLNSVESDVAHVVVGGSVDKAGDLQLDVAALFTPGSSFAQSGASAKPLPGQPLAGLPDVPFFFAFNGTMSGSFMGEMMHLSTKIMTELAKDAPKETIAKLEQATGNIFKELRSMSMVVGAGSEKESLFQNSYVIMKVGDAEAYLRDYEEYLGAYNQLMKGIRFPEGFPTQSMKSTRLKVDGLSALEVTADLGLNAQQNEPLAKMMELYLGSGGKMIVTSVAVDKNTLLVRYRPAAEAKDFIQAYKSQARSLADNKDIAQTLKLLPQGSQWNFFISPRGSVAVTHRIVSAILPQAGIANLPDFPQTPPVGIGVKLSGAELETRIAVPVAVLDAVGAYVRQLGAGKGVAGAAR